MTLDAIRVTCRLDNQGGEVSTNVWHVTKGGLPNDLTSAQALNIKNVFLDFYNNLSTSPSPNRGIKDLRPEHSVLSRVIVKDLNNGNSFEFVENADGTDTQSAPYQLAAVISLTTSTAGRRGRGRIYIGPVGQSIVESAFSSGRAPHIKAANRVEMASAMIDVGARLAALVPSLELSVYSPTDDVNRAATGGRVDDVLDTQRRRRSNLGANATNFSL